MRISLVCVSLNESLQMRQIGSEGSFTGLQPWDRVSGDSDMSRPRPSSELPTLLMSD